MNFHNKESTLYYLLEKKFKNKDKPRRRSRYEENKTPERLDTLLSLLTAPKSKYDWSGLVPPEEGIILTSTQKRQADNDGYIPGVSTSSISPSNF